MSELGDDSIYFNKNTIDSERYFQLFDKYIPVFYTTSNILIFSISNPVAIMRIMEKNPGARYIIVDEKETFNVVQILTSDRDFECVYINIDDFDWYNINMKFDCVIMNPPYSKNLHLKILEQAIKQLKDDDSVIVNLSPIRWLQDPIAIYRKNSDYYKFEKSISKHIDKIDIISYKKANLIFKANLYMDLAIYICSKNGGFDYKCFSEKLMGKHNFNILQKITSFIKNNNMSTHWEWVDMNNNSDVVVKINAIYGGGKNRWVIVSSNHSLPYVCGKNSNGKTYAQCASQSSDHDNTKSQTAIKFKTIDEANNFIFSAKTYFITFIDYIVKTTCRTPLFMIPWMGDAVNPRTGLKGYKSEWTNEDFYQFFNITAEEQKVIEDTMKQYM